MSVSGNILKKKLGKVGRKNIKIFYVFILFLNVVKCKNVVLICHIPEVTLKVDMSSHYAWKSATYWGRLIRDC